MTALEQRQSPRIRSFLRGEIIHSNGASKTECTIRDISDTGARIQAPPSVTVPEFFTLTIPQRGSTERAQIVWRHGLEIGVIFPAKAANFNKSDSGLANRVLALEAEVEMLRSQLADIQDFLHNSLNKA
jgi:PilZ domain